ncbi:MAG: hypothetical protein AABO57_17755 [Acidobacteriota bacterium]
MLSLIQRSTARSSIVALLIASIFSLTAPKAAAADRPFDSEKGTNREASSTAGATESRSGGTPVAAEAKTQSVLYVAFEGVGNAPVEPAPEPTTRPRRVARLAASVDAAARPLPLPAPPQAQSGVVSTAPMTAGEKFESWFRSRFLSVGTYGSAVFNGMWKELQDNDDFKKDTVENYLADSMTRAARSYAFGTTASFFEKALFASIFRQDPRYHRSGKTGAGAKMGYAVTRVFITQGDHCACHQFNASFLLGAAAASGTATLWERRERTGRMHTVSRFYNHIAMTALFNIVKEFVGGQ